MDCEERNQEEVPRVVYNAEAGGVKIVENPDEVGQFEDEPGQATRDGGHEGLLEEFTIVWSLEAMEPGWDHVENWDSYGHLRKDIISLEAWYPGSHFGWLNWVILLDSTIFESFIVEGNIFKLK